MDSTDIVSHAFYGEQVRHIIDEHGEPWFVAADVAAALGLSNPRNMTARLDEDQKGVRQMDTRGGRQSLVVINESGMYTAIIRSDSPRALPFRRWVTGELLPTIRRTGSYSVATSLPQSYAEALRELASTVEQLEAARPAAEAWEELASGEGDYEVADAAKILANAGVETGRQRLFAQLSNLKWIYRSSDGAWRAYQAVVDMGYLREMPKPDRYHPRTGERIPVPPQVRVTAKGIDRLRVRFATKEAA